MIDTIFLNLDPIEPYGEEENGKPFKCQRPNCKAAFCNKGNLRRHIVEVHEGKKRSDTNFILKENPEEESFDFAGNSYTFCKHVYRNRYR